MKKFLMDSEKQFRIEPEHYSDNHGNNMIGFIEDQIRLFIESKLTAAQAKDREVIGFLFGNYLKYCRRAGRKIYPGKNATVSKVMDMEKAEWYKTRLITEYKIHDSFFADFK